MKKLWELNFVMVVAGMFALLSHADDQYDIAPYKTSPPPKLGWSLGSPSVVHFDPDTQDLTYRETPEYLLGVVPFGHRTWRQTGPNTAEGTWTACGPEVEERALSETDQVMIDFRGKAEFSKDEKFQKVIGKILEIKDPQRRRALYASMVGINPNDAAEAGDFYGQEDPNPKYIKKVADVLAITDDKAASLISAEVQRVREKLR